MDSFMEKGLINQVTAQEARTQLSDLINRAVYAHQSSLITRQGKPVAVLVSYDEWRQLMESNQPTTDFTKDLSAGDRNEINSEDTSSGGKTIE
jgi:prevent-host-death family protein